MKGTVFVDTNIFIYAHDLDAGLKHDMAIAVLTEFWETGNGVISTQVLKELYVNVTLR
jgi:predicted nucleic acid-binding protein